MGLLKLLEALAGRRFREAAQVVERLSERAFLGFVVLRPELRSQVGEQIPTLRLGLGPPQEIDETRIPRRGRSETIPGGFPGRLGLSAKHLGPDQLAVAAGIEAV